MEILNHIWQTVAPYLAGISIGGIFTAVIYGLLRGAFAKTVNKINVDKIVENATEKGIEKVKEISFKHSIQPLVNSELEKVTEKANRYISEEMYKLDTRYSHLIEILEKLSAYFNNSVFVSEEAKEELNKAIEEAKAVEHKVESVVAETVVEKEEKKAEQGNKSTKTER